MIRSIGAAAVLALVLVTGAGAAEASVTTRGSVEQVYVTGLGPGARMALLIVSGVAAGVAVYVVVSSPADRAVVTVTGGDEVIAAAAIHGVGAAGGRDGIVAAEAEDVLAVVRAVEHVIAAAAVDLQVQVQGVAAGGGAAHPVEVEIGIAADRKIQEAVGVDGAGQQRVEAVAAVVIGGDQIAEIVEEAEDWIR